MNLPGIEFILNLIVFVKHHLFFQIDVLSVAKFTSYLFIATPELFSNPEKHFFSVVPVHSNDFELRKPHKNQMEGGLS